MSEVRSPFQEGKAEPIVPIRIPEPQRRRGVLVGGLVLVVLAGAAGAVSLSGVWKGSGPPSVDNNVATSTAVVVRQRLSTQVQANGTLGYAGTYEVPDRMGGTVTQLPTTGQVIKHGQVLFRVDNKPVILMDGTAIPAYRALSRSMKGEDVRQLNSELVALGYDPDQDLSASSSTFSAATEAAVKRLQKALGASQTGKVDLGQVLFLPTDRVRVTKVNASYGDSVMTKDILEVTTTVRTVTVPMDTAQVGSVQVGDPATITLPDQRTTPGKIASVSSAAVKSSTGTYTTDVSITLTRPDDTGRIDEAPVQVAVTGGSVDDALAVPVSALLALSGGGYAIEVVEARGHRLVPVTTGLFDDGAGLVQISGAGVAVGQKIVVPGS